MSVAQGGLVVVGGLPGTGKSSIADGGIRVAIVIDNARARSDGRDTTTEIAAAIIARQTHAAVRHTGDPAEPTPT